MVASGLKKEEIEDFERVFELFDKDADGSLSTTELGNMMRRLGQQVKEEELQDMLNEVDTDGNGQIDRHEFMDLMARKMKDTDEEESEFVEAFKIFDTDQNGQIRKEELKAGMAALGEDVTDEELDAMMALADHPSGEQINYDKFVFTFKQLERKERDSI